MNTMMAYAMGAANRGKERMVFDWDQAAKIIKDRKIKNASAGLQRDMEYTAGDILEDGRPTKDNYCYLASTWAVPVLAYYDEDGDYREVPCYEMESHTTYNEHTLWPKSAMAILGFTEDDFVKGDEGDLVNV